MEGDVRRWAWGVRGVGVGMTLWGHERQGGRSRGKLAGTRMSGRSVTETSYGRAEGEQEDTETRRRDKSLISGGSDPGEGTGERRKRGGFVARAPEELQAFPFAAVKFSGRYGWGR
jgi:hypothetical protein